MVSKRVITAIAGLGVIGALLLGVLVTAGHASAAPAPQAQPPANGAVAQATGKITALQSNGFTMQGRNWHVTTVIVGANTWIVVAKNNAPAQGTLADLKVGDTVGVAGA